MNNLKNVIVSIECKDLNEKTANWLSKTKPYGIILFKNNLETESQIINLINNIKSLYKPVPKISIDFEGGVVNRLLNITGKIQPPYKQKNLFEFGKYSGELLKRLDIDINFAPVVDIDFGLKGNGLDERYLGKSASEVVENAEMYLQGLESEGVTGCLKHYPGLGKVIPDTHFKLFEIENIDSYEELPFLKLSTPKRIIMIAHVYVDFYKEISTYCKPLIERIREFHKGLIITDDLSMKALPENNENEKINKCLKSGMDLALIRLNNPIFNSYK